MTTLAEIISRRTDLSTFIVHLTREYGGRTAKQNLQDILQTCIIQARRPYGSAIGRIEEAIKKDEATEDDLDSQKVVCFTETPLEHLHLMLMEIEDLQRVCNFAPYGIAMTKKVARRQGINPVWYVDITPGHDWLTNPINQLIEDAILNGDFANSDIAKLTPFIEQMGTQKGGYKKEFWWEREWRHRSDFRLRGNVIVLAPENEHEEFNDIIERRTAFKGICIDPSWGLEAIIARLAGFRTEDVGPF